MKRALVLGVCLIVFTFYVERATTFEQVPIRVPLEQFPMQLSAWRGARAPDLDAKVLAILGVDEYLNRVYRMQAESPVGLYIGYYQSQREGDTMHSPMNCLPGAGWVPVKTGHLRVPVDTTPREAVRSQPTESVIEINRYLVQKGGDSILVLYWYQSHGRVVASDYWSKFYMVMDALRTNRTDAALVRVIVPLSGSDESSEAKYEQLGVNFVRTMFPLLSAHLPA